MEILAIPKRQLSAVCSIDKGTLTVQDRPPVFTGENGAMEIVVTFKRNGTNYSIPSGVVATMYLYYPNTEIMTIASEMAVSGATATGLLSEVMVAKEGYPMLFVQLTDSETGDVIVAASYPIKVTKSRGKYVIDTRPPSPSEVVYVGKSPYINIQNNHWMEWDTETLQYKDSDVQADGYPPFINPTDKCWMVWDAENDEYINTHIKAEGENNIDDTAGEGDTDSAWSANKLVAEFAGKVPTTRKVNGHALTDDITVSKSDVGLGSVDNTSDANKPISTATQTALDAKVPTSRKVNGHALTADIDISAQEIPASGIGDLTVSGNPLVVEDAIESTAKKVVVGLEPIQDLHGYDNPWPGGCGKNKYDTATLFSDTSKFTINGNSVTGTAQNFSTIQMTIPSELVGQQLFFSAHINVPESAGNGYMRVRAVVDGTNKNGNVIFGGTSGISSITFIPGSTDDIVIFAFGSMNSDPVIISDIQLETGNTRTSFAPYENICPISGRTEVEVTRTGKNLIDLNNHLYSNKGLTLSPQSDGSFKLGGTPTASWAALVSDSIPLPIPLGPGTYTLSIASKLPHTIYINLYDEDATQHQYIITANNLSVTFTTTFEAIRYYVVVSSMSTSTEYNETIKLMLEKGSVATDWEEDKGETYPITFPQSAGTVYGGELTINQDGTGELVVDKIAETYGSLSLAEAFEVGTKAVAEVRLLNLRSTEVLYYEKHGVIAESLTEMSSYFGVKRINEVTTTRFAISPDGFKVAINDIDLTLTKDAYDQKYADFKFVYPLATPITYALTATQVQLLEAYNYLFADGNSLSLTYLGSEASNVQDEIDEFERVTNNILASIAPVETSTASASHAIGSYIMLNNQFCKVTTAIAAGETIAIGRNVIKTTLAQELLAIINS